MKLDQLYKDLGFPLEIHDQNEFKPIAGNVINMPLKTYICMSEQHAIKTHVRNLILTYGKDSVVDNIIAVLQGVM